MKILITTSSDKNTIAACYQKHLGECEGVKVIPAYSFDLEEGPRSKSIQGRVLARMFPERVMRQSTRYLLAEVKRSMPDFVVIIKGTHISAKAIEELCLTGIKVINYNPDHPLRFDSAASGNENIRKSLRYYHLVYTYSPEIKQNIIQKHPTLNVKVLPFGFATSPHNVNPLDRMKRINRICFAGTGDEERRSVINAILKAGFPMDVYGKGYDRVQSRNVHKLGIYSGVFGEVYNEILQSYDVQLNLFRNQNRNAHNMRTFEIPAVGGLQVAPYSDQCATFFEQGREIFMYRDSADLMKTLEHLLTLSDKENLEYRHAARSRCLSDRYSYAHRAQQMVEDLKVL